MKILLILIISVLSSKTISADFDLKYVLIRYFLYSGWITCDHDKDLNLSVSDIEVYFYDFQNNFNVSFKIDEAVEGITSVYNLDIAKKLIFFVPGYNLYITRSESSDIIREAFRDVPNIYLVIIDHSEYTAQSDGRQISYQTAVMYSYYIGQALGKFLADLRNTQGFPSKNMHCVGHSLGSHILGYAGIAYFNKTMERVWRITGLDPAGPCFSNSLIENQLRSGCAEYVEVYHCSAGTLGTSSVLADIDFFLYNGKIQPQCDTGIWDTMGAVAVTCSHKACLDFWSKTVKNPNLYQANRCDSYEDYVEGKCASNDVTIAGYSNPGNTSGVFYTSTEVDDMQ